MKVIGEFLLLSLVCIGILFLYLVHISNLNQQEENCRWDENMILQCDNKR